MNKVRKILLNILVTLLIYVLIYYLSCTLFQDYLFVWTAQNRYCYIWILSLLLILIQKPVISYCRQKYDSSTGNGKSAGYITKM